MSEIRKCKAPGCAIKARRDGFCIICYARFAKGVLDVNGDKTIMALDKERKVKARKRRKTAAQRRKQWKADKTEIRALLSQNPKTLTVLQDADPDVRKPVWCNPLEFWSCEVACFYRIFVRDKDGTDPECQLCHAYDNKFEQLKYFTQENAYEQSSTERV